MGATSLGKAQSLAAALALLATLTALPVRLAQADSAFAAEGAMMGVAYSRDMCSAAHQLALTLHDSAKRRPVGRSRYAQTDAVRELIAQHPASSDMIFELSWSMTDVFFDMLIGNMKTAFTEYHGWMNSTYCTDIGYPTPAELGLGEGLNWFDAMKG
jgi:hypothetical protein